MVMKVGITVDTTGFDRKLSQLKNGTARATATALNNTGRYSIGVEQEATRTVFDRPTPYTQNAFYLSRATTSMLLARVGVKNQGGRLTPDHWLYSEVEGGERQQKAFELALTRLGYLTSGYAAVPTRQASLDQYGNVSGGTLRSILSQLTPSNSSRRRRSRSTTHYFAIAVGDKHGGLGPGVYRRNGRIGIKVLAFVPLPRYGTRLPFYAAGQAAVQRQFPIEMRRAMAQMIATTVRSR